MPVLVFFAAVVVLAVPVGMIVLAILHRSLARRVEELEWAARLRQPELQVAQEVEPSAPVATVPPLRTPSIMVEPVLTPVHVIPGVIAVEPAAEPERPSSREWETTVGTNWLNKAGVVLLIVGIALLLGYSINRVGPASRVALGVIVSSGMLAAGVVSERRERYRIFGRGLLGGGWAGLYFTTYAAHAVAAARIITSPVVATVLLTALAAAMILHALRYRSQAVAGTAYFLGFVTLAISGVSKFAIIAAVPLAASLLLVAQHFAWYAMAAVGVPATYGLFLLHISRLPHGDPLLAQLLLCIYWLVFEGTDILRARRATAAHPAGFLLNAPCFVFLSVLVWRTGTHDPWIAPAIAAAVYLLSSLIRAAVIRHRDEDDVFASIAAGTYHGAIAIAAALAAVAIVLRWEGLSGCIGLLIEGELLFAAGYLLRQSYLRALGTIGVGLSMLALLIAADSATTHMAGRLWHDWSFVAIAAAAAFYVNRILDPAVRYFTYGGATLVAIVLAAEVPLAWLAVSWLLCAGVNLELGLRRRMVEFGHQAVALALAGVAVLAGVNVLGLGFADARLPHWPQLVAAVLLYAGFGRLRGAGELKEEMRSLARWFCSAAAAFMAAVWCRNVLPAPLVAVAWAGLALALLEISNGMRARDLRTQARLLALAACARLFFANFDIASATFGVSHRLLTAAPVIALQYYFYSRTETDSWMRRAYLWAAAIAAAALVRYEAGPTFAVVGWAVLMLVWLAIGFRREMSDLRVQSYTLAAVTLVRCWTTDLYDPQMLGPVPSRILTGLVVAACFFAAQWLSPKEPRDAKLRIDAIARWLFAAGASFVIALLLYLEIEGKLLTVAWGIEGACLLSTGFAFRERILRLAGLALLLVCTAKLFAYDLRHLETPYRIASFIVLGALMIGISWIYSRCRSEIEKYL